MFRAPLSPLILALSLCTAHAGPTTSDKLDDPQSTAASARPLPAGPRAAEGGEGSRTIDLLIDLQQRSAGLQFNERQRAAGSGEIKPRAVPNAAAPAVATQIPAKARVETPPTPPSGLFGSGATPMVQSARTATVEPGAEPGADFAPPGRSRASSSGEPLPRWWTVPRELIEYVRENRWLVLSSVGGGLLLIWGISSLFARAASNAGHGPGPQGDHAFNADRWTSARRETRPTRPRSHHRPG